MTGIVRQILTNLEKSQWWSADQLTAYQFKQLDRVVAFAATHVPYYQQLFQQLELTLKSLMTPETWRQMPILDRSKMQEVGEALCSPVLPEGHGPVVSELTSGSTGTPAECLATAVTSCFWRAMMLRDHLWQHRDFSETLASIRHTVDASAEPPHGITLPDWGSSTRGIQQTGPGHVLSIFSTTDQQAAWLDPVNPGYLFMCPSALESLAHYCHDNGHNLTRLKNVRTYGEVLLPRVREICRRVWGVSVADTYSSSETGVIALQCPDNEHLHVMSEDVLVEVLADDNTPCQPGETGRVVVTTLNNYAMPLLRYELGDYAEVGEPCSCGRGLPVLKRILGRVRNMFVHPNGARVYPTLDISEEDRIRQLPIRQYQAIQRDVENVDVYLAVLRPLTPSEEATTRRAFLNAVKYPFHLRFHYVDTIETGPTGKHEDFRSEVDWLEPASRAV